MKKKDKGRGKGRVCGEKGGWKVGRKGKERKSGSVEGMELGKKCKELMNLLGFLRFVRFWLRHLATLIVFDSCQLLFAFGFSPSALCTQAAFFMLGNGRSLKFNLMKSSRASQR